MMPVAGEGHGPFSAWDSAQAPALGMSQATAAGVLAELHRKNVAARMVAAPLRPLNNIAGAAIAIELAPPGNDASELSSPGYQQTVAAAVAAGVFALRDRLESGR
jgi:hypothetical protein